MFKLPWIHAHTRIKQYTGTHEHKNANITTTQIPTRTRKHNYTTSVHARMRTHAHGHANANAYVHATANANAHSNANAHTSARTRPACVPLSGLAYFGLFHDVGVFADPHVDLLRFHQHEHVARVERLHRRLHQPRLHVTRAFIWRNQTDFQVW